MLVIFCWNWLLFSAPLDPCNSSNSINHVSRSSFWLSYWYHYRLYKRNSKLTYMCIFIRSIEKTSWPCVLDDIFDIVLHFQVAASVAFLIARYFARERILKLVEGNKKFLAIDKAIGENGFRVVTLLRLSPLLPFSLGNYLYGLTSVKFVPYVLGRFAFIPLLLLVMKLISYWKYFMRCPL